MGLQLRAEELMKTIPTRDTVAGEALSMLCTSNTSLQDGDMVMRSPLAKVSVLLSSSTEFRFSIHMASTGPSNTIHMNSPEIHTFKRYYDQLLVVHCFNAFKNNNNNNNNKVYVKYIPVYLNQMCMLQTFLGFESSPPQR